MKWLIVLAGISAGASGSVLIKLAVTPPRKFPEISDPYAAILNWPFWLGISAYFAALLFYSASLIHLPMNVAHPVITSGTIAAVTIASTVIFHEQFHWTTISGIVLVIAGMCLITMQVS